MFRTRQPSRQRSWPVTPQRCQWSASALVLVVLVTSWVSPLLVMARCCCEGEQGADSADVRFLPARLVATCCQVHSTCCAAAECHPAAAVQSLDADEVIHAHRCSLGSLACENCGCGCECCASAQTESLPYPPASSGSSVGTILSAVPNRLSMWLSPPLVNTVWATARCEVSPLLWDAQAQFQRLQT